MLPAAQYSTVGTIARTTSCRHPRSRNSISTGHHSPPGLEQLLDLFQHHTEPPPIANNHMSIQKTVKVAAVQAAPVAFDLPKTLMKVAHFAAEAAKAGADLVVFP